MTGLLDKVVVVTGAARGTGRVHCARFADEGADVIALDAPAAADELRSLASEVEHRGRRCATALADVIARGAGAMILTNSIAGLRGLVGVAHYTAAKHGVVGLMRSLANELAPHNVRVNCVHPTNVDTPMIQNDAISSAFRPDLDRPPTRAEFAEAARRMNMLGVPWVDALDVANASLFLASDEARYITAVTLPVDAGATQR